jgi:oligopeptide/dipeptide ABC transporter ATP-binding protein
VGLVGESGCGKSITALSILRLIAGPSGKIAAGKIFFDGINLLKLSEKDMLRLRGNEISMIFQEPMTSLNPVFTVGDQIEETIILHEGLKKTDARIRVLEMLKMVGIADPDKIINYYPHKLSGGMRQRIMIAMAMSSCPKLLIADEPTTALDVTIQAQILELMKNLNRKTHTSILLITHDLGVVAEMCEEVKVMYCGKIVEEGNVASIFKNPRHPYTVGLLNAHPSTSVGSRLYSIPGTVPNPLELPKGCSFHPRCKQCMDICRISPPELIDTGDGCKVRCWLYGDKK